VVKAIGFGTDISINSDSAECSKFLSSIVDRCDSQHAECHAKTQSVLPHRVIDLGPHNDTDILKPRLYISNGEKARYIALSHCWGPGHTFKTEQKSFADRCRGIDLVDLPQNFRDAIKVARSLRVRYLWIDSLCIIQDDR
jgi:Heterokaryon incompatibility protein (HET)